MRIVLFNTGIKREGYKLPPADLYLDCRGIPNPFREGGRLAGMSGDAELVQEWVEARAQDQIASFLDQISAGISSLPTRRAGKDPYADPFRVCLFCAHGIHRSRAMKHILYRMLRSQNKLDHVSIQ